MVAPLNNCCVLVSTRTGILIYIYTKMMLCVSSIIIMGVITIPTLAYKKKGYEDEIDNVVGLMGIVFCVILGILIVFFLVELPFNICGLVGAHKENLCLLNVYFYFLIVSLCLQIIGLGWAIFDRKIEIDFAWTGIITFFNAYMLFVVYGEKVRLTVKNSIQFGMHGNNATLLYDEFNHYPDAQIENGQLQNQPTPHLPFKE